MASDTFDLNDLKRRMDGATRSRRTGRPSHRTRCDLVLEPVQVEAYGSNMPLNQVATVSVPEPPAVVQVGQVDGKAVETVIVT